MLSATHYDMIPNAAFVAGCSCHVPANKCSAFSPMLQTESGLDADGIAELFTPEGITHYVAGTATAMNLQATLSSLNSP